MEGRGLRREWGPFHFHPCPGTHIIRHPPSPYPVLAPAPPNTLTSPGRMPVDTGNSQARGRVGGGGGRWLGEPPVGRATSATPQPRGHFPHLDFGAEPRKEQRRRRGGGGREGQGGSAAQFVAKFFFFSFFPFFLCKKCTKAGQPLCNGQQCFLGEGGWGGDPRPGTPAWD